MGRWKAVRGCLGRDAAVGVAVATLLSGCGLVGGPKSFQADVPNTMTVTSRDFAQRVGPPLHIGAEYTCHGAGKHPGIHWSGAPQNTKSLALVVDDSAAPVTPYIYWIVFDIGPQTTGIQVGSIPTGARQARNSRGTVGYDPPCPVKYAHEYRFTVYALRSALRLPAGTSAKAAWTSIAQAAVARGRLTVVADP